MNRNLYCIYTSLCICLTLFLTTSHELNAQSKLKARIDKMKAKTQKRIAEDKTLTTPYAAPGYTPELGGNLSGGVLFSFKTAKDTLTKRSSVPLAFIFSTTGAFVFSSNWVTYWKQDKLRVYAQLWARNMPDNYFGVGYDQAVHTKQGDSTSYYREYYQVQIKPLFKTGPHSYTGPILDLNYTDVKEPNLRMQKDYYYQKFGSSNLNSGVGISFNYDTRDFPQNAYKGKLLSCNYTVYSQLFGSWNNYEVIDLEYRQYQQLFRKGQLLSWALRSRSGFDDIPYAEMGMVGSPNDLRGYYWGKYRDNCMNYAILEYRHKFYKRDKITASKSGVVFWTAIGAVGTDVSAALYQNIIPNIGVGYRFEVQPRMNLRLDFGVGTEAQGFYINFQEAF